MLHSITFDFDVKPIIQLAEESRREIQLSPLVKEMVASRMDHWAVVREANLGEQHLFLSTGQVEVCGEWQFEVAAHTDVVWVWEHVGTFQIPRYEKKNTGSSSLKSEHTFPKSLSYLTV